jgi:hypothetical protein
MNWREETLVGTNLLSIQTGYVSINQAGQVYGRGNLTVNHASLFPYNILLSASKGVYGREAAS